MKVVAPVPMPDIWETCRGKYLFERIKRDPIEDEGVITAFRDGQVTLRSKRREDGFTNAELEIGYQGIRAGDLVIHGMDGFAGAIGVSDSDGKASPVVHAYTSLAGNDPRYYAYLLRDLALNGFISSLSKGIRQRSTAFDSEMFKCLELPMPPLAQQKAIADYLDRETARIDALIEKREKLIRLILDKLENTAKEMFRKNSDSRFLRRHLMAIQTGTTPSEYLFTENATDSTHPWFTPSDFGKKLDLNNPSKFLIRELVPDGNIKIFPKGAVLVIGIGATTGRVAVTDQAGSSNQQITALMATSDLLSRYLAWQLWARRDEILGTAPYSTLPIINNDFLKSLRVSVPDLSVQQHVVSVLDELAHNVENIETTAELQAKKMRERRQALITAAVTGELEIPEAAA